MRVPALLEIRQLAVQYGIEDGDSVHAVRGLDLAVAPER